jgi:hypothetical protein
MFNPDSWARTEPHLRGLPGSPAMCQQVRKGAAPWTDIAGAMSYCTWFPAAEFGALLASGDFDVRWPLTFAAWYWGASGASVDEACADFLSAAGLWDQALEVLPEYNGPDPEWLSDWRTRFEECRRTRRWT